MNKFTVKGLRLPSDLYSMIVKECKRKESIYGFWPGINPVIIDALYSYFDAIEASYEKEFFE